MGQDNIRASDRAAVVGVIDPDANTAGTLTTGWINMANWGRIMATVMAGDLGASATLDAKLEQAQTAPAPAPRTSPARRSPSLRRPGPTAISSRLSIAIAKSWIWPTTSPMSGCRIPSPWRPVTAAPSCKASIRATTPRPTMTPRRSTKSSAKVL